VKRDSKLAPKCIFGRRALHSTVAHPLQHCTPTHLLLACAHPPHLTPSVNSAAPPTRTSSSGGTGTAKCPSASSPSPSPAAAPGPPSAAAIPNRGPLLLLLPPAIPESGPGAGLLLGLLLLGLGLGLLGLGLLGLLLLGLLLLNLLLLGPLLGLVLPPGLPAPAAAKGSCMGRPRMLDAWRVTSCPSAPSPRVASCACARARGVEHSASRTVAIAPRVGRHRHQAGATEQGWRLRCAQAWAAGDA